MANTQNLKPWPKGTSGNPGGRPRQQPLTDALLELLSQPYPRDKVGRTYAQRIALTLCTSAVRGSVRAAQEVADRVEGRATQRDSGTSGGNLLTFEMLDKIVHGTEEDEDAPAGDLSGPRSQDGIG